MKLRIALALLILLAAAGVAAAFLTSRDGEEQPEQAADWRRDWGLAQDFALDIDTEGYQLPSSIAFVPEPGPAPDDPLYFVTELRGTIKVVTNDRTVHTFAKDFFQIDPKRELPDLEGEVGLAGLCLAPQQGYVFVTFSYQDADGLLRNNIARFSAAPGTFSLAAESQLLFTDLLADFHAAPSHQIGSCQVSGDSVYIGVGDGRQTEKSQQTDQLLGKVLRMDLDGKPLPDNPFYVDDGADAPEDYVWAYGLRNPYGLAAVDERLFVADNGRRVDRFLDLQPGRNYLWDGTDWSIGAVADASISPAVGPAQLSYVPESGDQLPEQYRGEFVVALSAETAAGVLAVPYRLDERRMTDVPSYLARWRGEGTQFVTGVALGPDGLYFSPILPDASGSSAIYRVSYDPERSHPVAIEGEGNAAALINEYGCLDCHSLNGEGGSEGPQLDRGVLASSVKERVNSQAYLQSLDEVDRIGEEPYVSYRGERDEVRRAEDWDKIRTWTIYHIMEPRFDNPNAQMPNLGLTKGQATVLADYLLEGEERSLRTRTRDWILERMPDPVLPRHVFYAFAAGSLLGGAGALVLAAGALWFRRRRA